MTTAVLQAILYAVHIFSALWSRYERQRFSERINAIRDDPVAEWNRRFNRVRAASTEAPPVPDSTGATAGNSRGGMAYTAGHGEIAPVYRGERAKLPVKWLGPGDIPDPPSQKTVASAGFDITANSNGTIAPFQQVLVPTGWAFAIPDGWVGFVKPRSGLAVSVWLDTKAGVIDADYRGELRVVLRNDGPDPFRFKRLDRIAQLVILPCLLATAVVVDELPSTERGDNGFGSTGVRQE